MASSESGDEDGLKAASEESPKDESSTAAARGQKELSGAVDPAAGADIQLVERAFGAENRARLIDAYFAQFGAPTAADAWKHVYRMLLWADPTTGLAHCYESDKSQPGKAWYLRSLAFHEWASQQFGTPPSELATVIDWLFARATTDLAATVLRQQTRLRERAKVQLLPFADRDYPVPGEDPELVRVVTSTLGEYLKPGIPEETWRTVVQRVRQHVGTENKRRNLVGEGFEDVLAQVLRRVVPSLRNGVHARALLADVPGFAKAKRKEARTRGAPRGTEKPDEVDLVLLREDASASRTLVTVKWSIRADREKQFPAEYQAYAAARSDRVPFQYVLVTNEFDPARLSYACDVQEGRDTLFSDVVHISPDAVRATYEADARLPRKEPKRKPARVSEPAPKNDEQSKSRVLQHIANGRLLSLEGWLNKLLAATP